MAVGLGEEAGWEVEGLAVAEMAVEGWEAVG